MAITFVGSNTQVKNDGNPINMSLPATVQGDLVLVFTACRNESFGGPPFGGTGYTQIADLLYTGAPTLRFNVSYKFMGAIQDTVVGVPGTGISSYGTLAMALVFRGVNTSSPLDVAVTTDTAGAGIAPRAPGITPIHTDCCVVRAAMSMIEDTSVGAITGSYLPNPSIQAASAMPTGVGYMTAAAVYKILTAVEAQAPASWTTWSVANYISISIALQPQTASTDFNTVDKATVTLARKTVPVKETTPVSKYRMIYSGKVITVPDGLIDSIFVDKYRVAYTGKTVNPVDIVRVDVIPVTKASVLRRGRTVTPRDIQFEDIPRYAVRGRGSGTLSVSR